MDTIPDLAELFDSRWYRSELDHLLTDLRRRRSRPAKQVQTTEELGHTLLDAIDAIAEHRSPNTTAQSVYDHTHRMLINAVQAMLDELRPRKVETYTYCPHCGRGLEHERLYCGYCNDGAW